MSHKRIITTATRNKTQDPVPLARATASGSVQVGAIESEVIDLRSDLDEHVEGDAIKDIVTWYIDPINGDDDNKGDTELTALKSLAGFFERTRVFRSDTEQIVVQLLGDVTAESEPGPFGGFYSTIAGTHYPTVLTIRGQRTVIATGTFTSVVTKNFAINPVVLPTVTDSALTGTSWADSGPGGSSLVEKQIRIVGGPRDGAYSTIYQDMGSKEARIGPVWDGNIFGTVDVQVGDAYEIVELTKFAPRLDLRAKVFEFDDICFTGGMWAQGCSVQFKGCVFEPTQFQSMETLGVDYCLFLGCFMWDGLTHGGGNIHIYGCLFGRGPGCDEGGSMWLEDSFGAFGLTASSCEVVTKGGGYTQILGSYGVVNAGGTGVVQGRPGAEIFLRSGATIWSEGANGTGGQGVWLASNARFFWHPLVDNIATRVFFNGGYINDFRIGEDPKDIADLTTVGYTQPVNHASMVPTKRHPGD